MGGLFIIALSFCISINNVYGDYEVGDKYLIFINGTPKIEYTGTKTKTTVLNSACPNPTYTTETITGSQAFSSGIYIITTVPNAIYSYNGYPDHCLSFCGTRIQYIKINTTSGAWIYVTNPLLIEQPDYYISALDGSYGSYGRIDHDSLTITINGGIYYNSSTKQFYVDFYYTGSAPLQYTSYPTSSFTKPPFKAKLFHNNEYKEDIYITFNSLTNFITKYGDGTYKIIIPKNTRIGYINLIYGTCVSTFTAQYKIELNADVEYEYTISGTNITNQNLNKPTSLDYIEPYYEGPGMYGPDDYFPPENIVLPEPEEGEEEKTYFRRLLQEILDWLFDCDELSLSRFENDFYYIMNKFPFCIYTDLSQLVSGSSQCVSFSLSMGENSSSFNICDIIPSSVLTFVKNLINIIVLIILFFSFFRFVDRFFGGSE